MANYKIEKNVELPKIMGRAASYPFGTMEVGDSFAYSTEKPGNVNSALRHAAKRVGIKLTIRAIDETSFRAWRIE